LQRVVTPNLPEITRGSYGRADMSAIIRTAPAAAEQQMSGGGMRIPRQQGEHSDTNQCCGLIRKIARWDVGQVTEHKVYIARHK
jgi:hypothetical protein